MCGLFGALGTPSHALLLKTFQEASKRGPNAWGLAWKEGSDLLQHRQQGSFKHKAVQEQATLFLKHAEGFIGQTRLATSGSFTDNDNNQPLFIGTGTEQFALSHNGNVYEADTLVRTYHLVPHTRCDSEVLGLLLLEQQGSLLERTRAALACLGSFSPFALLLLSREELIVARAGQPLYVTEEEGAVLFCSRKIQDTSSLLPDRYLSTWSLATRSCMYSVKMEGA